MYISKVRGEFHFSRQLHSKTGKNHGFSWEWSRCPGFFSGSSAGKVVDLEKLHGTDRFPEWASNDLGDLEVAEEVYYTQNHGFLVVSLQNTVRATSGSDDSARKVVDR